MGLRVALAIVGLSGPLLAQRSDRGILTGIVTDPTGSSVLGATVKVRNEETGVETTVTTSDAWAYDPAVGIGQLFGDSRIQDSRQQ